MSKVLHSHVSPRRQQGVSLLVVLILLLVNSLQWWGRRHER